MDLLHIATAGSVDDGKSTLIGRLLYETGSVPKDKLAAIEAASARRGFEALDLSLLTDGLIAEREQGITIDVAHVYFNSNRRKYVIADTPGHVEYTRNMVTGASQAAVSIILIDARNGVVEQTARHFYIASMLRVPTVIVCVNKMDLVDYSQARFEAVCADMQTLIERNDAPRQSVTFLPMVALHGDNVIQRSDRLGWYDGPSLFEVLESVEPRIVGKLPARMSVQSVIRPRAGEGHLHDYRGYAGRVISGQFTVGDTVVALPGAHTTRLTGLERFGEPIHEAAAGASITALLSDDIDVGRGHLLAHPDTAPSGSRQFEARMCWLDHTSLKPGATYLIQAGVARTKAKVTALLAVINVATLRENLAPASLELNEIGTVTLRTAAPLFLDRFDDNPANGAFILIDEFSNNTVAVGFVRTV